MALAFGATIRLLVELGVRSATSSLRNAACTRDPRCEPASLNRKPRVVWPPYLPNPVMAFLFPLALAGAAALSLPPSAVVRVLAGPSFATRSVFLRPRRCWRHGRRQREESKTAARVPARTAARPAGPAGQGVRLGPGSGCHTGWR